MSNRIELIHSGIGDGNDLIVESPLNIAEREHVDWVVYLVGTRKISVNYYSIQRFTASITAHGHISSMTYLPEQSVTYRITEYKRYNADFRVESSLSRSALSCSFKISVEMSDGYILEKNFNNQYEITSNDRVKLLEEENVASLMSSEVSDYNSENPLEIPVSYSVVTVSGDTEIAVCFKQNENERTDIFEISHDVANSYYVYAYAITPTEWKNSKLYSDIETEEKRLVDPYEYSNGRVVKNTNDFAPITDREVFVYGSGGRIKRSDRLYPKFHRNIDVISEMGTELLYNEPRITYINNSYGAVVNSDVGEEITINSNMLSHSSGTIDIIINPLELNNNIRYILKTSDSLHNIELFVDENNLINLHINCGNINHIELPTSTRISQNQPTRLILRWTSSGISLYYGTTSMIIASYSGQFQYSSDELYIGHNNHALQFDGIINFLAIYDTNLSDEEINNSIIKEESLLLCTAFEPLSWKYYWRDINADGLPDEYPAITYTLTNLSDEGVEVYLGDIGDPDIYETIPGETEDNKQITIRVQQDISNTIQGVNESIVVTNMATFERNSIAYSSSGEQISINSPTIEPSLPGFNNGILIEDGFENVLQDSSFDSSLSSKWNFASLSNWSSSVISAIKDTAFKKFGTSSVRCGDGVNPSRGIAEKDQGINGHKVSASQKWTYSFYVYSIEPSTRYVACVRFYNTNGDNISQQVSVSELTYSNNHKAMIFEGTSPSVGNWNRIYKTFTVPSGAEYMSVALMYYDNGSNCFIWFDGLMLTLGDLLLTYNNGIKRPDNLSVTTAGLNPSIGSIEGIINISDVSRITGGRIFNIPQSDGTSGISVLYNNGWTLLSQNNDGVYSMTAPATLSNGWYRYLATWTTSLLRLRFYSISLGTIVYDSYVQNPALPKKFGDRLFIGSNDGVSLFVNSIHDDIRFSNIERNEIAGTNSPLTVDANTIMKLNFDTGVQINRYKNISEVSINVSRSFYNSILRVEKITNSAINNVVMFWESNRNSNEVHPPISMCTTIDEPLVFAIPILGEHNTPWTSDPIVISGTINGTGSGERTDYYKLVPIFDIPSNVTMDGYSIKKLTVNGEHENNLYNPDDNSSDVQELEDSVNGIFIKQYSISQNGSDTVGYQLNTMYDVNEDSKYIIKFKAKLNKLLRLNANCFDELDNPLGQASNIVSIVCPEPDQSKYQEYIYEIFGFASGTKKCTLFGFYYDTSDSPANSYIHDISIEEESAFTKTDIRIEGEYIRGSSTYTEVRESKQETTRIKVHTGDSFSAIITDEMQIGPPLPKTTMPNVFEGNINEFGDTYSQLSNWQLNGVLDTNSDNGTLYYSILGNSNSIGSSLLLYKDSALINQVASGTTYGQGEITISQNNSSGITGKVLFTSSIYRLYDEIRTKFINHCTSDGIHNADDEINNQIPEFATYSSLQDMVSALLTLISKYNAHDGDGSTVHNGGQLMYQVTIPPKQEEDMTIEDVVSMLNELKGCYQAHRIDTIMHNSRDNTNAILNHDCVAPMDSGSGKIQIERTEYQYDVLCFNPSIEMWVEDDGQDYPNYTVWARRRSQDLEKWNPYIRKGFYYLNEEEYYFFANKYSIQPVKPDGSFGVSPSIPVLIQNIQHDGTNIVVTRTTDEKQYRQVAPTDIYEIAQGTNSPSISYRFNKRDLLPNSLHVMINGEELSKEMYVVTDRNIRKIAGTFRDRDKIELVYQVLKIVENIDGNNTNKIYLQFTNIIEESIAVIIDGAEVDKSSYYSSGNEIILNNGIFSLGSNIVVTYNLKDSFYIERGYSDSIGNWTKIYFIEDDSNIEICYEGISQRPYYSASEITCNPLFSNTNSGFLYLTDEVFSAAYIKAIASPNKLPADGYSIGKIIVDVTDKYNNPVPNVNVIAYGLNLDKTITTTDYSGQCSFTFTAPIERREIDYTISLYDGNGYVTLPVIFYEI